MTMVLKALPPIQNYLEHCRGEHAEEKADRLTEYHGKSLLCERELLMRWSPWGLWGQAAVPLRWFPVPGGSPHNSCERGGVIGVKGTCPPSTPPPHPDQPTRSGVEPQAFADLGFFSNHNAHISVRNHRVWLLFSAAMLSPVEILIGKNTHKSDTTIKFFCYFIGWVDWIYLSEKAWEFI